MSETTTDFGTDYQAPHRRCGSCGELEKDCICVEEDNAK